MDKITKICLGCEKEFSVENYARTRKQKCCSRRCASSLGRKQRMINSPQKF